jgi:nucleoside-diphosphate-sugar epimerase
MDNHLLCIGMGYAARALARRLVASDTGWKITGTATNPSSSARITAAGWTAVHYAGGGAQEPNSAAIDAVQRATHIVISAAPDARGDPILYDLAAPLAQAPHLQWIGYLSTIGVYGDHQGAWIDEETLLKPTSQRSVQRAAAEAAWLDFADRHDRRVQIFRLAGIYGPGRSAIDNLREATARRIIKPGQVFNRIHVDDIANVLKAAIAKIGSTHRIYNLTDDEPAPPQDVIAYAAGLLGMPVPPDIAFADAPLSPMGLSFYSENKRVRNARIKSELGIRLAYPTYREGMMAIAATSKAPLPPAL